MRNIVLSVIAAVVAAATTFGIGVAWASPSAHRDRPPECVLVHLITGSQQSAWVEGCGGAGGQESPFQDWLRTSSRQPVNMDGVNSISAANCPRSSPCVILAENAPKS